MKFRVYHSISGRDGGGFFYTGDKEQVLAREQVNTILGNLAAISNVMHKDEGEGFATYVFKSDTEEGHILNRVTIFDPVAKFEMEFPQ